MKSRTNSATPKAADPNAVSRKIGRRVTPAIVAVAFLGGAVAWNPSPAAADGTLRYEGVTTYTVDPAARVVHVAVDITLTNNKPNADGFIYFYDTASAPVPKAAINLNASRNGSGLSVSSESVSDEFSVAQVRLASNLLYGQTQTIRLAYDLPSSAPRSNGWTRVNPAFAEFFAYGVGDDGLGTVEVRIPESFDYEFDVFSGDNVEESAADGFDILRATGIDDSLDFTMSVEASDEAGLITRMVRSGRRRVDIRAWPDDPEWVDFVERLVRQGIPKLENLIGLGWSEGATLVITETVAPYRLGFAGWYSPSEHTIDVGDELDSQVILHELSHSWFNHDRFEERWLNEGLAEEYSSTVSRRLGGKVVTPEAVKDDDTGRIALNAWDRPNFRGDDTGDIESYGYNTSFFVIHELMDEIGPKRMAAVMKAVDSGRLPYPGPEGPEKDAGVVDWRRVLDLLEDNGKSKTAARMFRDYVVTGNQKYYLRRRADARTQYFRLQQDGRRWAPPFVVRYSMLNWDFPRALSEIKVARRIVTRRDDLTAIVKPLGITMPSDRETRYEAAKKSDLKPLLATIVGDIKTAKLVASANADVEASRGIFAKIGLLGTDPDEDVTAAERSFERGEMDDAQGFARTATETIEEAESVGKQRAAIAGGSLIGLGGVVVLGTTATRRRRRARARRAGRLPGESGDVPEMSDSRSVAAGAFEDGAFEAGSAEVPTRRDLASDEVGPPGEPDL